MLRSLIGFLLLIHAGYSLSKYRKYIKSTTPSQEYTIPLDILLEVFLGISLNILLGILFSGEFKNIKKFTNYQSYDTSVTRLNFKTYYYNKASLNRSLKEKFSKISLFS